MRSTNPLAGTAGRRRGFTLVELLVVIGIIALLISILLPSLNRARQSARTVVCLSNQRQMGQGIALYTNESDMTLPYGLWNGVTPGTNGFDGTKAGDWTLLIKSHIDSANAGGNYTDDFQAGGPGSLLGTLFQCPETPSENPANQGFTHYSSHPRLMPDINMADTFNGAGKYLKPYGLSRIDDSARKVLIFDGSLQPRTINGQQAGWVADAVGKRLDAYRIVYETFLVANWDNFSAPWLKPGYSIDLNIYPNPGPTIPINSDSAPNWQNIRFRHQADSKVAVLHVDGHAETYGFRDGVNTEITRDMVYVNP